MRRRRRRKRRRRRRRQTIFNKNMIFCTQKNLNY